MTDIKISSVVNAIFSTTIDQRMPWLNIDTAYGKRPKELDEPATLKPLSASIEELAELGLSGDAIVGVLGTAFGYAKDHMQAKCRHMDGEGENFKLVGGPTQIYFDPHKPLGISFEDPNHMNGFDAGPIITQEDAAVLRDIYKVELSKYLASHPDFLTAELSH